MRNGLLPPNSIVDFLSALPASAATVLPARSLPVRANPRTRGSAMIRPPRGATPGTPGNWPGRSMPVWRLPCCPPRGSALPRAQADNKAGSTARCRRSAQAAGSRSSLPWQGWYRPRPVRAAARHCRVVAKDRGGEPDFITHLADELSHLHRDRAGMLRDGLVVRKIEKAALQLFSTRLNMIRGSG